VWNMSWSPEMRDERRKELEESDWSTKRTVYLSGRMDGRGQRGKWT
jgi:hypothetical protein